MEVYKIKIPLFCWFTVKRLVKSAVNFKSLWYYISRLSRFDFAMYSLIAKWYTESTFFIFFRYVFFCTGSLLLSFANATACLNKFLHLICLPETAIRDMSGYLVITVPLTYCLTTIFFQIASLSTQAGKDCFFIWMFFFFFKRKMLLKSFILQSFYQLNVPSFSVDSRIMVKIIFVDR